MGNVRIAIDSPEAVASINGRLAPLQGDDASVLQRLADFLNGIGGGQAEGKVRINSGAVQATNLVALSSFVENDYVTLNGVALTGKNSPTTGATRVQFRTGVSDEDSANDLRALINASSVNKIVGVVTARRRATVTCASVVSTDTLVINGVTLTVADSPTAGTPESVKTGSSDTVMAENLMNAIAKSNKFDHSLYVVSAASGVLTIDYYGSLTISSTGGTMTVASKTVVIDCLTPGQIGNLCTLAISAHGSVTGANFASGTEGTEVLFDKFRAIR